MQQAVHPPKATPVSWITPALGAFGGLILLTGIVMAFLAPPDVKQGFLTRILPFHAVAGQVSYLAFITTLVASSLYLWRRTLNFDRIAAASAEVGIVFIAICLFTGSMWGRPTWGAYWQWEPRLTSTALLFVMYIGYLMVRGLIEDPHRRARVAAAIGVVAAVGVPINYMSVYWWRSLHQLPSQSLVENRSYLAGNPDLHLAYYIVMLGMIVFYAALVRWRSELGRLHAEQEERQLERELQMLNTGSLGHSQVAQPTMEGAR
jgi:heme exporter protein C